MRQPVSFFIIADLVYDGAKGFLARRSGIRSKLRKEIQKRDHALLLQTAPEKDGIGLAFADQRKAILCRQRFSCQKPLQQGFIQKRRLLARSKKLGSRKHRFGKRIPKVLQQLLLRSSSRIHLGDKEQDRQASFFQQLPERMRMRLHPIQPADDQHRRIRGRKDPFRLRRKIHMAGRIQKVQLRVFPAQRSFSGKDRNAPAFFLRAGIKGSAAFIDSSGLTDRPAGMQQRFGKRSLAGVDMRREGKADLFHGS